MNLFAGGCNSRFAGVSPLRKYFSFHHFLFPGTIKVSLWERVRVMIQPEIILIHVGAAPLIRGADRQIGDRRSDR
jgi:hypothetical protein